MDLGFSPALRSWCWEYLWLMATLPAFWVTPDTRLCSSPSCSLKVSASQSDTVSPSARMAAEAALSAVAIHPAMVDTLAADSPILAPMPAMVSPSGPISHASSRPAAEIVHAMSETVPATSAITFTMSEMNWKMLAHLTQALSGLAEPKALSHELPRFSQYAESPMPPRNTPTQPMASPT